MLLSTLIHPEINAVLAGAGHSSLCLIADANYPATTMVRPGTPCVHLGLRPGLPTIDDVLATLLTAAPVEMATFMDQDDGQPPAMLQDYLRLLGTVPTQRLERQAFYRQVCGSDLALVVVSGDVRPYANILLTIGTNH